MWRCFGAHAHGKGACGSYKVCHLRARMGEVAFLACSLGDINGKSRGGKRKSESKLHFHCVEGSLEF